MNFLLPLLAVVAMANAGMMPEKLVTHIMEASLFNDCWGKGNMQAYYQMINEKSDECLGMEPTITTEDLFEDMDKVLTVLPNGNVPRRFPGAPAAVDGDNTKEMSMMMEIAEKIGKLKMGKAMKVSNLTCTMIKMGMWNEDESINIEYFRDIVKKENLVDDLPDEFLQMNLKKYEMCYKKVQNMNTESLPKKSLKRFGKQLKFHQCVLKSELKVCLMRQMSEWMEAKYGEFDPEKAMKLGLPPNKYEAAYMKTLMKKHLTEPSKFFVMEMLLDGESDPFA